MHSSCRASFSNIHPRAQTGTTKQHAMKILCDSLRKSLLLPLPRMISRPAKTVENGDQLAATNVMALKRLQQGATILLLSLPFMQSMHMDQALA